jgi:dTDP-glucose pyrophosphorylase
MISESEWKKSLLSPSASIEDAIKCLINSSLRIVLVADENLTLLGSITDGDIRRGLLRGLNLSSPASGVMNRDPIVVEPETLREDVIRIMLDNRLHQIPIVTENRAIRGLHIWDEFQSPPKRSNVVVIMAGGKGTRLLPLTENTPKPMLRIAGKPILEHIINRAKSEGFSNFMLAIHHLGEVIENHFGDGRAIGVNISYLREESPLGTAGALSLISQKLDDPFIVVNGDVIADIHYEDMLNFHLENQAAATLAVQVYESQIPYGVVATKGISIAGFEEKPIQRFLINAGVYILEPTCLEFLEEGKITDMTDLFDTLSQNGLSTIAFMIHERWTDIGRHEEFIRARREIEQEKRVESGTN